MLTSRSSRNRSRLYLRIVGLGTLAIILYVNYAEPIIKLPLGLSRVRSNKQWDADGYWYPPREVTSSFLWSYIPGMTEVGVPVEEKFSWDWANTIRRTGYRRPSWGGLREVGPKASLRTNLKPGLKYLTASPINGWNNQVIETMNAIYIALLADRIPVANLFYAHHGHIGKPDDPIPFTEIFDVSALVKAWGGRPIVDAIELKVDHSPALRHRAVIYDGEHPQKAPDGRRLVSGDIIEAEKNEADHVDCWSLSMVLGGPDYYEYSVHLPITHTYTPLPKEVDPSNNWSRLSGPLIAETIRNYSVPGAALPLSTISRLAELQMTSRLSPVDNYLCLDRTYFVCEDPHQRDMFEDWKAGKGAWEAVGRHLKFQPGIQRIADDFLRYTFGLDWNEPLPNYMAVHIRRGDMYPIIKAVTQRQWAWRARQLLDKYNAERGVKITHVVFTTDEQDETWLKEMELPGWYFVNHISVRTAEKLGYWWPTLIDSAILSSSSVILGIASSTMTMLAALRVRDAGGMVDYIWNPDDVVPVEWTFEI